MERYGLSIVYSLGLIGFVSLVGLRELKKITVLLENINSQIEELKRRN